MTHTETATAASAGQIHQSPISRPTRPLHEWGSMEIAQYANQTRGNQDDQ